MTGLSLADVATPAGLFALGQVILIDLLLAGDNVVVLGTLAAGVPAARRGQVLSIGIAIALAFLIGFALVATRLLHIVGLLFAGGLLLIWVAWKLLRDLRARGDAEAAVAAATHPKSFGRAVLQVALADLSMSLDNVLAVAGAAREHPTVLFLGLGLSVTLTAVAANLIARVIGRYPWLAYIGLAVIVYVGGSMLYNGWIDPAVGVGTLVSGWR